MSLCTYCQTEIKNLLRAAVGWRDEDIGVANARGDIKEPAATEHSQNKQQTDTLMESFLTRVYQAYKINSHDIV